MQYKIFIRNHFGCRFSFLLPKYYLQFLSDEQLFVLLVVLGMFSVLVLASFFLFFFANLTASLRANLSCS